MPEEEEILELDMIPMREGKEDEEEEGEEDLQFLQAHDAKPWMDDAKFTGQLLRSKRHGKGKLFFKNRIIYEGDFEDCFRVQGVLREIQLVTVIEG